MEINYLNLLLKRKERNYKIINIGTCTETAVIIKMKRLGLGNTRSMTGLLSPYELAKSLNVDSNSINGWINNTGSSAEEE